MTRYPIWDPLVRLFHWTLVAAFVANSFFTDDEGDLHIWVGYVVVALIAVRIIWGLVGSKSARFSSFTPTPFDVIGQVTDMATGRKRVHLGHTPLGALMIYNLILAMLAIGVSGYMMGMDAYWGADWVEELHEATVLWAQISIVLHIAAVLYESRRTGVNLPKAMITGVKSVPKDANIVP